MEITKTKYEITGIDCPNCAAKLADMFSKLDGVSSAKINFLTEKLTVESELDSEKLYKALSETAKSFSKSVKISK